MNLSGMLKKYSLPLEFGIHWRGTCMPLLCVPLCIKLNANICILVQFQELYPNNLCSSAEQAVGCKYWMPCGSSTKLSQCPGTAALGQSLPPLLSSSAQHLARCCVLVIANFPSLSISSQRVSGRKESKSVGPFLGWKMVSRQAFLPCH